MPSPAIRLIILHFLIAVSDSQTVPNNMTDRGIFIIQTKINIYIWDSNGLKIGNSMSAHVTEQIGRNKHLVLLSC